MLPPVQWLSEKLDWEHSTDPDFTYKIVDFYTKFKFKNITAEIGDFVLISNADSSDPDTVDGCDIGQLVKLYESHDKDLSDRFRAHVQWFSRAQQSPTRSFMNSNVDLNPQIEILEDHRPFDRDVSIETFYRKCEVIKMPTTAIIDEHSKMLKSKIPTFMCRFQIVPVNKRKCILQPVLDDERKQCLSVASALKTPKKESLKLSKIGTPTSLVKKMEKASLNDDSKEWVVKCIEPSKVTLMRDITNSYKKLPESPVKRKCSSKTIGGENEDNASPRKLTYENTPTRKSSRASRVNLKYDYFSDGSPEKVSKADKTFTPKRNRKAAAINNHDSEDDFVSTPKKEKLVATPKCRRSLLIKELTPSISARKDPIVIQGGALQVAKESLHVSSVPLSLPCREQEFNNIYSFIEGKINDHLGGCMYVSGVPGTGKTATVTEVIRCLHKQVKLNELPYFEFIEINGMRLTEPRQSYVQIYKQLTGKTLPWEQACNLLEAKFTKSAPRRCTTVLLVDELDVLCNKRQDVLYNLLDWPSKSVAHLVVIAIANTMDLPERLLMGRVASRLGLTRLTFQPYTYNQLQSIVTARLSHTGAFNADAVQLVARKVAAVSGDARRALDICRRAVELAEVDEIKTGVTAQVSLFHVNQALTEMIASPKVQAIKSCSRMEQMFLQAITAEVQRTGIEETTFDMVYRQLESICAFVGSKTPTITDTMGVCCRLGSCRLIISDQSRSDINQKILLNVSSDDVHYATQKILT